MAWLVQRVSAVYLALFLGYLLIKLTIAPPPDHAALVAWTSGPLVRTGLLLLVPVLLVHAWVGVRDVLIDYVHPLALRVTLMSLFAFVFLASGLWALQAILTAGLAG